MDVTPDLHFPLEDQPSTSALTYVDSNVSPQRTWTITIPFATPVRFEIGLRAP